MTFCEYVLWRKVHGGEELTWRTVPIKTAARDESGVFSIQMHSKLLSLPVSLKRNRYQAV